MNDRKRIEQQVEETLASLDGLQGVEAPAFFYTRLQARMEGRQQAPGFWNLLTRPAVSLVTVSLLLILNITAITLYVRTGKEPVKQEKGSLQSFAEEFNFSTSSL